MVGVESGEVERLVERGEVGERHLRSFGEEPVDDAAPVEDLQAPRVEVEGAHEARPFDVALQHDDVHAAHRQLGGEQQAGRSCARDRDVGVEARVPRMHAHRARFLRGALGASVFFVARFDGDAPRRFASASSAAMVSSIHATSAARSSSPRRNTATSTAPRTPSADESRPLRGDPVHLALQHVAPHAKQWERDPAFADATEGERHGHGVGRLTRLGDRLLAQDGQLAPSLRRDLVDRARRPPPLGLGSYGGDEPFRIERAHLAIQRAHRHASPRCDVRLLGGPPDPMSMPRPMSVERAEEEESSIGS